MTPQFLPTSLDAISPTIDLETAINLTTGRKGPHDYSLFTNANDDLRVKIDGQMLSLEEARPVMEPRIAEYAAAADKVLEGLQSGSLRAFVRRSSDNTFWQIPRFYFLRRKSHQLAGTPFAEWGPEYGEDPSMYGQPIMLSEAQFSHWNGIASEAKSSKPGRGRKLGVGGYAAKDAEIARKMHAMIEDGRAASPWDAAGRLLSEIAGAGTDDAKRKRVVSVYKERYDATA